MFTRTLRATIAALSIAALTIVPTALASGSSSSTSTGGGGNSKTSAPAPATATAPCASLTYKASAPALVYYGTATFTTTVTNCSTSDESLVISYAAAANDWAFCKANLGTWSDAVTLRPAEVRTLSTTKLLTMCLSTDSVNATVTAADGTVLATANSLGQAGTTVNGQKKGGLAGL